MGDNQRGNTKAKAKNLRTSQTREHTQNARAVWTLKTESLHKPNRSGETRMKRVKWTESGKAGQKKGRCARMNAETGKEIIRMLEAARNVAATTMTHAQEGEHDYYNAYYTGKADALYEALAIVYSML